MIKNKPSCKNCRFWEVIHAKTEELVKINKEIGSHGFHGYCRRFPRQVRRDSLSDDSALVRSWEFPLLGKDDWCGEWKPKRKK